MKRSEMVPSFRGRFIGIAVLVIIQFLIGIIHIISGFTLLLADFSFGTYSITSSVYSAYTLMYGCFTFFFAYLIWNGERLGWIGTVAVSLFVIIADILTLFNMLDILGIPQAAAIGEIPYSILIIIYLLQNHVRSKYNI